METEDSEDTEKVAEYLVDLSNHSLRKIERADEEQPSATVLILDNNEIQRLDNLDSYPKLKKLSLVKNHLIRMYGVSHLTHLVDLNLSNNSLVTIEGLKDLKQLKHLNLSKNKIKTMDHLHHNLSLETLDLSENNIALISDLSALQNLKELSLNFNKIAYLRNFDRYLPENIEVLRLHDNSICDLNEVSLLSSFAVLKTLTFAGNPCVSFGENQKMFNYRPFIKNWCSSLIDLDSSPLDDIECLKAEWLYSQGRGRSFRIGESLALSEYLSSVCPLKGERNADHEDVKKLKLILSKAQLHQQQLREELSTGNLKVAEISNKLAIKKKTDDRMLLSFQESPKNDLRYSPEVMARSLDSSALRNSPPSKLVSKSATQTPLQASSTFIPVPDSLISPEVCQPKLSTHTRTRQKPSSLSSRTSYASSKNSTHSTPESKRKMLNVSKKQSGNASPKMLKTKESLNNSRSSTPMCKSSSSRNTNSPAGKAEGNKSFNEKNQRDRETSDEDSDVLATKAQAIQLRKLSKKQILGLRRQKAVENFLVKKNRIKENIVAETDMWKAAVCIQRWWRGYSTRNLNRKVVTVCKNIQINRMQDYIMKLVSDMEATKMALEGNRKLQVLQMQAINALWKKISSFQPSEAAVESGNESKPDLNNLIETCSLLNRQVEGLQKMVETLQGRRSGLSFVPSATQTEIIAVHTPQGESLKVFPFNLSSAPDCVQSANVISDSLSKAETIDSDSFKSQSSSTDRNSTTTVTVTELFTCNMSKEQSKETFCDFKEVKDDSFLIKEINKRPCTVEGASDVVDKSGDESKKGETS